MPLRRLTTPALTRPLARHFGACRFQSRNALQLKAWCFPSRFLAVIDLRLGTRHTAGLVARQGVIATEHATVVKRLLGAGFIPLATTNVSELCMWYETNNHVYGRTRNPYNLERCV